MSAVLPLSGKTGIYSPIEQAEREDRTVRKWINNFTPSTTELTMLTNIAFNIPIDTIFYVTEFFANIEAFSKNCDFLLVKCTGQNGSGTVEEMTARTHIFSAAAGIGFLGQQIVFRPSVVVRYSDGWRSICVQVQANDIANVITCSWAGWWEVVTI